MSHKLTITASLLLALALLVAPVQADEINTIKDLTDKHAAGIVSVKVVLKLEINFMGQAQNEEQRVDLQGVVVDPSGLIMCSARPFSAETYKAIEARSQGRVSINASPSDFKIIFEREEKEYTAFLAATDSKLELAFLQIEELADRKITAVDFGAAAKYAVGQKVFTVTRLEKGYDYATNVQRGLVTGIIKKPRKAAIIDGTVGALGLPVFTASGEVIGVLTTLSSGIREEGGGQAGGLMGMLGMARGAGAGARPFLLPGKVAAGVIAQAKKRAAEVAEERATSEAEEKAEGDGDAKKDGEDEEESGEKEDDAEEF